MEDLFKKFMYTGIGWISITTEKFKKTIEKFVEDGKISTEEGKKIVDEFMKNTESKREELEDQFKTVVDKILKSFSFAKKADLQKLEKRIADLEAGVKKDAPKAKKSAPKKAPVKKPAKKTSTKKDSKK